ncbi:MAG TPA: hypothetical protein VI365_21860 [Trebonia sp.]
MREAHEVRGLDSYVAEQATGGDRHPVGRPQLIQKVAFGLGAAVLAGAVVVAIPAGTTSRAAAGGPVLTSISLGAAINSLAGEHAAETTCCG